MPLCIAGMHRSGTSMAASLLYHCGLDLGPQNDMLSPTPNNPEGFWESRSFLRLNDAILKHRGGTWDNPPSRDVLGWENEPSLRSLRTNAERLIRRFDGREPWGWKDPRNCLTLSWWRILFPTMTVLICVRNPLAVAESLRVRDGISYAHSFDLWLTYNRSVLMATSAERRVVTHCDSYLNDPRDELRRVLHGCGIVATNEQIERACRQVKPSLVHHRMTRNDLVRAGASEELMDCYDELWDEAAVFCPNWGMVQTRVTNATVGAAEKARTP